MKKEKKKKTSSKIISPKYNIISEDDEDNTDSTIICKKCLKPFICIELIKDDHWDWNDDDETSFFDCPHCDTKNTIEEYQTLLKNNFFNPKNEK